MLFFSMLSKTFSCPEAFITEVTGTAEFFLQETAVSWEDHHFTCCSSTCFQTLQLFRSFHHRIHKVSQNLLTSFFQNLLLVDSWKDHSACSSSTCYQTLQLSRSFHHRIHKVSQNLLTSFFQNLQLVDSWKDHSACTSSTCFQTLWLLRSFHRIHKVSQNLLTSFSKLVLRDSLALGSQQINFASSYFISSYDELSAYQVSVITQEELEQQGN